MDIKKKSNFIMILLVIAIILSIALIIYFRQEIADEKDFICIAENSVLYVSKTCTHCAQQEAILKKGLEYFNITDITEHPEFISELGLKGVPTWIIDGKEYEGVQSIEKLKEITGC